MLFRSEIGGMPICLDETFDLFAPDRPSSYPLCLAYKAVQLVDPDRAAAFLYRLRYAAIAECRPATKRKEIMRVVRQTDIDPDLFRAAYSDGSAPFASLRKTGISRFEVCRSGFVLFSVRIQNDSSFLLSPLGLATMSFSGVTITTHLAGCWPR